MPPRPTPVLPTVTASRYLQPLREGGSLPAVVDTDDGLYVVKFRGAGQGAKALIAELIAGMLALQLDLPMPAVAVVDVPPPFGRSEPDPEIQEILRKSHGANVGLRFLDGAFNFDVSAAGELVSPELAARIVWFDAWLTNPDRTHQNPNLLVWNRTPWLIDHGAALYAQHDWPSVDDARAHTPFARIRDHVLLRRVESAEALRAADRAVRAVIADDTIARVMALIPDLLFEDAALRADFASADEARAKYTWYLKTRLAASDIFVDAAATAYDDVKHTVPQARIARR